MMFGVCVNGVGINNVVKIDVCVDSMLQFMYECYLLMIDLLFKVVGMLVMFLVIEVGFVFGVFYGQGVLCVV